MAKRAMKHVQRSVVLLALLLAAAFVASPAFASAIVGRDAKHPTLTIDSQGRAHVTYHHGGGQTRLVASGAINARPPSMTVPQVKFRIRDGQGGKGVCLPYDGPPLAWLVKACKAPDGTYWALQAWKRLVPNYGGTKGPVELHLSHWSGPLAQLVVYQNWAVGRVRHIFGRFTYDGQGVYGFRATPAGRPLDSYGRNVYVDAFDSRYGKGWHRENSFLTHHRGNTPGDFCYGFYKHSGHQSGDGKKYRATVEGPGVTPDAMWKADDVGPYDAGVQSQMQALERSWGDPKCRT
ncbi:MAG: hypothetical protein C5B48_16570 [Candidatus Rokuibacteriota bacterium]|nr:MAG: hypothetical protein C5B48_16570 [Candidatus Rokubacteria bacterium]